MKGGRFAEFITSALLELCSCLRCHKGSESGMVLSPTARSIGLDLDLAEIKLYHTGQGVCNLAVKLSMGQQAAVACLGSCHGLER